jgi:hypothetical protein
LLECGSWCKLIVRIEIPKLRERNKFTLSTDLVLVSLTVADCSLSLLDVLCAALGYCGENMSDRYVLLAILAAVTCVALGAGKTSAVTSVHYAAVSCRRSADVVDPEERERMAAREAARHADENAAADVMSHLRTFQLRLTASAPVMA